MGSLISRLVSAAVGGGGPMLECDPHDNKVSCCSTTEVISNSSSSSSHGSDLTRIPERWPAETFPVHTIKDALER